jgi:UDP-N-acetylmuramyl tripeptide synthase
LLNLAKNPTGFNQNLRIILADPAPKAVAFFINDKEADGHDVSWLWDVDFERLAARPELRLVMAGGHRAHDLQVRFKYAGIEAPVVPDVGEALARAAELGPDEPLYVLTNYSALRPTQVELERKERHDG